MSTPNNIPAFPFHHRVPVEGGYENRFCNGMSLLDYFAAHASDSDIADIMKENLENHTYNISIQDTPLQPRKPVYNRQQARLEHGRRMIVELEKGAK